MKRLIICAALAAPLAMGSFCAGAEEAEDPLKGAPCKELHEWIGPAKKMQHKGQFAIMAKVLRLTDAQQAQIKEILKTKLEENAALMGKISENRKLLWEKSHAATFDEAGLRALAEKQGQLMARMIISPAIERNKIRSLLTPEQRDLDDRVQPLLKQGLEHRPNFGDEEFPPFMGMVNRPHFQDEEFSLPMKKGPGDCPPFCDEY